MKARMMIGLVLLLVLPGCASLVVGSVVAPAVENFQQQTDLDLVCEGAPAYLLMIDSLAADDPDSERMLLTAARAYGAYAAALDACGRPERARRISDRAREYGAALLTRSGIGRDLQEGAPAGLEEALAARGSADVPALFWGAFGWTSWLQRQGGDPASLAALVKVEQIMLRVLELDPAYAEGGPHLFLGAYYGSRPALLGGDPEAARRHFEAALDLSRRGMLAVQVAYAETYARTVFDRALYENLLGEVLSFPLASRPEFGLANVIAQKRAAALLREAESYF
ncbi:MAG: TRAP transporter TatT component family protein [Thermodesulfobacteriota bacterium]